VAFVATAAGTLTKGLDWSRFPMATSKGWPGSHASSSHIVSMLIQQQLVSGNMGPWRFRRASWLRGRWKVDRGGSCQASRHEEGEPSGNKLLRGQALLDPVGTASATHSLCNRAPDWLGGALRLVYTQTGLTPGSHRKTETSHAAAGGSLEYGPDATRNRDPKHKSLLPCPHGERAMKVCL
jgi:hypothetical protein